MSAEKYKVDESDSSDEEKLESSKNETVKGNTEAVKDKRKWRDEEIQKLKSETGDLVNLKWTETRKNLLKKMQ